MIHTPFYDPQKSYEENYAVGPFGAFADPDTFAQAGSPQHDYFGHKVFLPFGIPAGPLLNSKYIAAAFKNGWDVCVYKTVRSGAFPCHPYPNVLPVKIEGDLTPQKMAQPIVTKNEYSEPLSITNSFGVPSQPAEVWQQDVEAGVAAAGQGQVMVLSFMGTVRPNQTQQEFIDDYVLAARLAAETSAPVLETNLSCPNIGNEGLVCYNLEVTEQVCRGIRQVIGNKPLLLKVGYYANHADLERLAEIANEYADGIAAINTLPAEVRTEAGEPALPGPNRLRSGICGTSIKWAGIEMVQQLAAIRAQRGFAFKIEGVGGVTTPADFRDYQAAGADSVMSATGAMWNPFLAQEVKRAVLSS